MDINKKVGDWFFVAYNFVDCPFADLEVGKEVIVCHGGIYYRMKVTHRRLHGISGEVIEVLGSSVDANIY